MTITEQQLATMESLIAEALEAQAERERIAAEVFEKVRAEAITKARAAITDELRRIMGQAYDLLRPELLGHISAPCARFSYRETLYADDHSEAIPPTALVLRRVTHTRNI